MSNGSKVPWAGSRRVSAWLHEAILGFALAHLLALLPSCHHSAARNPGHPEDPAVDVTGDQLFSAGLYHARRGDFQRAEQYLNAARQSGYDEASAVFWLVRVCIAGGRYHSALRHAAAYLQKQPDDWALRLVVASIHEALGDLDRARSDLEAIVDAQPRLALAHYRLGMLYRDQRSATDLARHHLGEYLRLSPAGPHGFEATAALDALSRTEPVDEWMSLSTDGDRAEPGDAP